MVSHISRNTSEMWGTRPESEDEDEDKGHCYLSKQCREAGDCCEQFRESVRRISFSAHVRLGERGAPVRSLYSLLNFPAHCLSIAVVNGGTE